MSDESQGFAEFVRQYFPAMSVLPLQALEPGRFQIVNHPRDPQFPSETMMLFAKMRQKTAEHAAYTQVADEAIAVLRGQDWSIWANRAALLDESEIAAAAVGCDWLDDNGLHGYAKALRYWVNLREQQIAKAKSVALPKAASRGNVEG